MLTRTVQLDDTSWKRLGDVLKTSLKYVLKTFQRRLKDVFKTSSRRLWNVLERSWSRLKDGLNTSWKRLTNVFKTYDQDKYIRLDQDVLTYEWGECICLDQDVLKTSSEDWEERHLQGVFIKTDLCWVAILLPVNFKCSFHNRSSSNKMLRNFIDGCLFYTWLLIIKNKKLIVYFTLKSC